MLSSSRRELMHFSKSTPLSGPSSEFSRFRGSSFPLLPCRCALIICAKTVFGAWKGSTLIAVCQDFRQFLPLWQTSVSFPGLLRTVLNHHELPKVKFWLLPAWRPVKRLCAALSPLVTFRSVYITGFCEMVWLGVHQPGMSFCLQSSQDWALPTPALALCWVCSSGMSGNLWDYLEDIKASYFYF